MHGVALWRRETENWEDLNLELVDAWYSHSWVLVPMLWRLIHTCALCTWWSLHFVCPADRYVGLGRDGSNIFNPYCCQSAELTFVSDLDTVPGSEIEAA